MNIKKNIEVLLENGFHFNTISKLTKNQIRVLVEKINKEETKEAVTVTKEPPKPTEVIKASGTGPMVIKPSSTEPLKIGVEGNVKISDVPVGTKVEALENKELKEKFESKAQQGLFWAKCKNSTGKTKKKWCKMAEEFSDSTSKKQYKDMPEKKHPEKNVNKKTIKSSKSKTNESQEKFLEDSIVEMLEKHINPSMTKSNLVKSINERVKNNNFTLMKPKKLDMFSEEQGIEMKRPITKLPSMDEDTETAPSKPEIKPGTKKPGKRNPFKKPGPKENPKAEDQKNDFMSVISSLLRR
jgi:hypothetical protein